MTENEAKNYFKSYVDFCENDGMELPSKEPYDLAISALGEIQQYRALGTVEEFREAMEKQRAKKPKEEVEMVLDVNLGLVPWTGYYCSDCGALIKERKDAKYCFKCGQAIDWSEEE